jgi:hypothetical protein
MILVRYRIGINYFQGVFHSENEQPLHTEITRIEQMAVNAGKNCDTIGPEYLNMIAKLFV